jgi:hypothetical protein
MVDAIFCAIGVVLAILGIAIWRITARTKKESQPIGWCFTFGGIFLSILTAASLLHLLR